MPYKLVVCLSIALQTFQVLFLLLHDWMPLGTLNDVSAQRRTDSLSKRLLSTSLSTLPFAILLLRSFQNASSRPLPSVLLTWLWVAYALLFFGEIRAWWIPYIRKPDPERAARYRELFGRTHTFLSEGNGIRPNTLHVILHIATAATLCCLAVLSWALGTY